MPEVITDMELYNKRGIIYNDLIDVVKKHISLEKIDSATRYRLADKLQEVAYLISEY